MKTFQSFLIFFTLISRLYSRIVTRNTVGSECDFHNHCAKNEYCLMQSQLLPPCPHNICHCMPNYEVMMDCSFQNVCSPVRLDLGDTCCQWTASSVFVSVPHGSRCSRQGRVVCRPRFQQQGDNMCVSTDFALPDQVCESHDDCSIGGMICSHSTLRCKCPMDSMKFDYKRGFCVKRQFGDHCWNDGMCQTFASTKHQGYTYNSAACSLHTNSCYCGNNTETVVSYLDNETGQLRNSTICVPAESTTGLNVGDSCDPDPIYSSVANASVRVCRAGLVCYKCPGELSSAKCRILIPPPPPIEEVFENPNSKAEYLDGKVGTSDSKLVTFSLAICSSIMLLSVLIRY